MRHPQYPFKHAELCVIALFVWLALWAGCRAWIAMPVHEHLCPEVPACVCPEER